MPELPEVETVRRGLEALVVGKRIDDVVVTGLRSVRRQSIADLVVSLAGRTVSIAGRRGKYLLIGLDNAATLVVHLRMSGQLLFVGPPRNEVALVAHTHARIAFDDDSELRFVDQRTFGELFVTADLDPRGVPVALSRLGADPLVDGIDPSRLAQLASARRTTLKAFLLDQAVLAGIGNMYADEACFRARILPTRMTGTLRRSELDRLVRSVGSVLDDAVRGGGSTLRDARYVDLLGAPGRFQEHHCVYGREGEPCVACGRPIRRVRVAGRSTHFCPSCQR